MATMEKIRQTQPMLNANYDLIHLLDERLQMAARYDLYIQDAKEGNCDHCVQLFQNLKDMDMEATKKLRDEIVMHVQHDVFK